MFMSLVCDSLMWDRLGMAPPTLRRRRLSAELRRLREQAGFTLDQAAERCDLTKSTLSRIETSQIGVRPVIVRVLLGLYGIAGEDGEALLQLARDARKRGWWQAYSDVLTTQYADYISLEAEACAIRNYEPLLIPGLLQTEAYAREVVRSVRITASEEEINRSVAVRMARQQRLTQAPLLDLWAIVDESTLLRRSSVPGLMCQQLQHLLAASRLPNVTIQVLMPDAGLHPGMVGSFSVIEAPDQQYPDVVYVDCMAGELYLEDESEARRVNTLYNHLRAKALDPDRSATYLTQLAERVESGP